MFEVSGKKKDSGADVTGTTRATGSLPIEGLLDTVMEKNIEDPFERMRFQVDLSNLKKAISYKNGGMVGYQDGGMIGPPLPPEMMGQAMNQQLSDSIDMRMANPQMGGDLGIVRQESDAIEKAMKDNIARNARLALQKRRLDMIISEQMQNIEDQEMKDSRARDLLEFLKMQTMQRGMGSVKQGMGDEPMRLLR